MLDYDLYWTLKYNKFYEDMKILSAKFYEDILKILSAA